jgi:hypothetical protein
MIASGLMSRDRRLLADPWLRQPLAVLAATGVAEYNASVAGLTVDGRDLVVRLNP